MTINLLYAERTSEKLRRILRSQKVSSFFENTLLKLLCKTKHNIVDEISFMKHSTTENLNSL